MSTTNLNHKPIKVIGHRGYPQLAPENTLSSFSQAMKAGAQAIELDVHYSKDQQLIVHHDYALGTPDNGGGLIISNTLTQIEQADAGSWFKSEFADQKIPTLQEVFELCGDKLEYEIELKGCSKSFVAEVLEVSQKYGLLSSIEFTSPHLAVLSYIKQLDKQVKTGLFCSTYPEWMSPEQGEHIILGQLELLPADVAHLPLSIASPSLISAIQQQNKRVHIADCNSQEELLAAKAKNCDQISTNNVELALRLLS